ncbi:MAG: glycosyltransferase family A protein [bacterium]|nr:glycosyltransferase family A protein [bacterium]
MISIIIPTYNSAKSLSRTVGSIFAQSVKDTEIIVVDDGSTDATFDALKPYMKRITYSKQENKGAPAARNAGFARSHGEYVLFCDADMILEFRMFEKLLDALEKNPQASFAYSAFKWGWKTFSSFSFNAEKLKLMNYIHTSALIRREHFPGFDESLKKFQDWDVWLTMSEKGHVGMYVPEVLYTVVQTKGTMSSWLPTCMYGFPWKRFGITIPAIERYEAAKKIIFEKHQLRL